MTCVAKLALIHTVLDLILFSLQINGDQNTSLWEYSTPSKSG